MLCHICIYCRCRASGTHVCQRVGRFVRRVFLGWGGRPGERGQGAFVAPRGSVDGGNWCNLEKGDSLWPCSLESAKDGRGIHIPAPPPPPTGLGIAAEEEVHVSAATWAWVVGGRDVICPGSVEVSSSVSSDGRARRRQQLYHKFPLELAPRCQSASHLSTSTPGPGLPCGTAGGLPLTKWRRPRQHSWWRWRRRLLARPPPLGYPLPLTPFLLLPLSNV